MELQTASNLDRRGIVTKGAAQRTQPSIVKGRTDRFDLERRLAVINARKSENGWGCET